MKRKAYKSNQYVLNGAKINSGCIGRQLKDYFVTGDSHNYVKMYLYTNMGQQQQVLSFTSAGSTNVQAEVSAVNLSWDNQWIYSGSNRGMINIWDISQTKCTTTLKGHSTSVNCFAIFPQQPNKLASGSYDTHIKLWDIREKNNTATLKHHTKQINSIDISPDGRMLLSGAEDNYAKLWDLRYPEKLLANYSQHSAPIVMARFNPEDCMFATCSMDKTAKYFRCQTNHYSYISSTDLTAMPITAIDFSEDGRIMYTASNDMLKCWNMGKNGQLVETIETSWRGIHDICYNKGALVGIASHGGYLSVWICDLQGNLKYKQHNDSQPPLKVSNKSTATEKKKKQLQSVIRNVNLVVDKVNNLSQLKNEKEIIGQQNKIQEEKRQRQRDQQLRIQVEQEMKKEQQRYRQEKEQKRRQDLNRDKRKKEEERRQYEAQQLQNIAKQRQEINEQLHQTLDNIDNQKDLQLTLQIDMIQNPNGINLSTFMGNSVQREKIKQIQVIGELMKDSSTYQSILKNRMNCVKPFIYFWSQNKIQNAMYTLQSADVPTICDCINAILQNAKFRSAITPEAGSSLLASLIEVMKYKRATYVTISMNLINQIANIFKQDIIRIKNFNPLSKGDLSREQRIAKYDKLVQQFLNIFNQERLRKYTKMYKNDPNSDLNQAAHQLYNNLEELLRKIVPKNEPLAL